MVIDSAILRAYQFSTGVLKKGGIDQAIGRSRGGLTTKIYVICDAFGNPVELDITQVQDSDTFQIESLLEKVDPDAFLAGKAYEADGLIDHLTQCGITPVIPQR